jgi:hypothetical protein
MTIEMKKSIKKSKILITLLTVYISGCAVIGCNLMGSHEFTYTFIDSSDKPLPGITVTCLGEEAGNTIASGYNKQKLVSNTKGIIAFHRNKIGRSFSHRTIGLFSWNHKNEKTNVFCTFLIDNKMIYESEIFVNQKSKTIKLQ